MFNCIRTAGMEQFFSPTRRQLPTNEPFNKQGSRAYCNCGKPNHQLGLFAAFSDDEMPTIAWIKEDLIWPKMSTGDFLCPFGNFESDRRFAAKVQKTFL
jgi:hypothetical protein